MRNTVQSKRKIIVIALLLLFITTIIPLYYIGVYAHPSADDYSYGIPTSRVWEATHSATAVFQTAAEKTIEKYNRWQGNFSAIFLMYLQPGILGENYYMLAPLVLLTVFLLCSFYFYYTVFRRIVNSDRFLSFSAAMVIVNFALQFTHVPSDSFYWYNGAVYYTFFYSLSLFLYALMIELYICRKWIVKTPLFVLCAMLSFIIGGSNYSTALLNAILLFFTCVYSFYKKKGSFRFYSFIFLSGLAALLISMSGPGNDVRQASIGTPHSVIGSILLSFVYGAYSIANATTIPIFLFWFLLIPLFYKMLSRVSFSFRHPLLLLAFSFCIYSAQITPVIYAQGIRIPYRIRNIVYFNYYPFVALNLFYFLGYITKKYMAKASQPEQGGGSFSEKNARTPDDIAGLLRYKRPFSYRAYYTGVIIAFLISCFGAVQVNENASGEVELSNLPFTASAVYSLATGEAKRYDEQANERVELLRSSTERHILLEPFEEKPFVLYHSDITANPRYWKNMHLAMYYHKKTVRLKISPSKEEQPDK